jgi:hypothetical protein
MAQESKSKPESVLYHPAFCRILDHLAYDTDFEKLVGWPLVEIRVNNAQKILSQRSSTVEVVSL